MSEPFDPYLKWLGIRDPERPPNHYRLLGVDLHESDPEVINSAADRRMAYVRTFQTGQHASQSQVILSELAIARRCLLNTHARADYDLQMRADSLDPPKIQPEVSIASARVIGPSSPVKISSIPQARPVVVARRTKKSKRFVFDLIGWIGGGVAAIVVGYFIINSEMLKPSAVSSNQQDAGPTSVVLPEQPADDAASLKPLEPNVTKPLPDVNQKPVETPAQTNIEKPSKPRPTKNEKIFAPWSDKDRLPKVPASLSEKGSADEQALKPVLIGLAMRRYDLVKQFLPKVKAARSRLSQPIDIENDIKQLETFWSAVNHSSSEVRVGEVLSFRNQAVRVSGVSDRSIELTWPATAETDAPARVKRFQTRTESMDRDFAIALALRGSSDPLPAIDTFSKYDFAHAKLALPPELMLGTGLSLPDERAALTDPRSDASPLAKKAAPNPEKLAAARATIRDLYDDNLAASDFVSQTRLAQKWLDDASSTSDLNLHYALLDEASELAVAAGNGDIVFTALSEINSLFEFDFWGELPNRLDAARRKAKTDAQYATITNGLFESINLAVLEEKYDIAHQLSVMGYATARNLKSAYQQEVFGEYRKQLDEMQQWEQQSAVAEALLKDNPESSASNMAMAQYLCFVKGNWESGMPHLAKSEDNLYAPLAAKELLFAANPNEHAVELADAWYELGKKAKRVTSRALLLRSLHWYEIANQNTTGLEGEKIRLRIKELQPLLEFFDPYQDDPSFVESTTWRFGAGDRVVFKSAKIRRQRFEYEFDGKLRRLNITKTGDTYQVEPDPNTVVRMRLMRNRQMELWQFNQSTGQLISAGIGIPIEP